MSTKKAKKVIARERQATELAEKRAREALVEASLTVARAHHLQALAERRSAKATLRIAEMEEEQVPPFPTLPPPLRKESIRAEMLRRKREFLNLNSKEPYYKDTRKFLKDRIKQLTEEMKHNEEEDSEATESDEEQKEEGSETESDEEPLVPGERVMTGTLLPDTRIRTLLKTIASNFDRTFPEFNNVARIKITKEFAASLNQQLENWVRTIMSNIEFTSQSDNSKHGKISSVSCTTKTVKEDVIRDAVELARPKLLQHLNTKISRLADDDRLLVTKTRLLDTMKAYASKRRIAKDALELMRKALFVRAYEVLLVLMKQMHKEHRDTFDVCPPF